MFIGKSPRKPIKLECISAASERACALAARGCGHSGLSGYISARYSMIASESQTVMSPSRKAGHLPEGENRSSSARVLSCANGITITSNAMPQCRIKIHGRKDQEE
jgi:hypothetical protein